MDRCSSTVMNWPRNHRSDRISPILFVIFDEQAVKEASLGTRVQVPVPEVSDSGGQTNCSTIHEGQIRSTRTTWAHGNDQSWPSPMINIRMTRAHGQDKFQAVSLQWWPVAHMGAWDMGLTIPMSQSLPVGWSHCPLNSWDAHLQ